MNDVGEVIGGMFLFTMWAGLLGGAGWLVLTVVRWVWEHPMF